MVWLAIAVGGALGSMARHGVNVLVHGRWPMMRFPLATFVVNVTGCLVIGLPSHLDGTASEQTTQTRRFAELLSDRLGLPLVMQDERLSSREAEERLALQERDWRKRKGKLDAAAAAVILQDYLDSRE